MPRAAASALAAIANDLRTAHREGDSASVLRIVAERPLLAWYAIPIPETQAALTLAVSAPSSAPTEHRLIGGALLQLLKGELPTTVFPDHLQAIALALRGLRDRLHGAPSSALQLQLSAREHRTATSLFDISDGVAAFESMQIGVTRMLRGDFADALVDFAAVRWNPGSTLPFLTRDAHAKEAVIHAFYGSPAAARRHLEAAAKAPRTPSWVEAGIDAHLEIARAVDDDDADAALHRLEQVPLADVGELWPFHIEALYRVHARLGRGESITRRLERMRAAAPSVRARDGMPGNIFDCVLALDAFFRGDHAAAKSHNASVDPGFFRGAMMQAMLDIVAGNAESASRRLAGLRAATEGLDQLEGQRLALVAQAQHAQGRSDDALDALRALTELPDDAGRLGARLLTGELHDLARVEIPTWEVLPCVALWPEDNIALTDRERELLVALHSGLTRTEIADRLFVSINTVKTHQRSLFRKLGVTTRAEAAAVAERRGLL